MARVDEGIHAPLMVTIEPILENESYHHDYENEVSDGDFERFMESSETDGKPYEIVSTSIHAEVPQVPIVTTVGRVTPDSVVMNIEKFAVTTARAIRKSLG